jgi:ATP-dependent DNA ligase
MLARESPASIVFFDLLCEGDRDRREEQFGDRRRKLEAILMFATPPIHLTPATYDSNLALDWFSRFERAGLDGVMAKPISGICGPRNA